MLLASKGHQLRMPGGVEGEFARPLPIPDWADLTRAPRGIYLVYPIKRGVYGHKDPEVG